MCGSDYKKALYSVYATKYTAPFYGTATLQTVSKQFPVWDAHFLRHFPENRKARIAEIGCGDGSFLLYLKNRGYEDCIGIDVSQEQLDIARRLGVENVHKDDLTGFLQNKRDTFDVIIMRDILEHFNKNEIIAIVQQVHAALKSGGRVIIQCPNAESPFFGRIRYGDFTHDIAFTKSSLLQLLLFAGFRKYEAFPTGPVVRNFRSCCRYLLWKLAETAFTVYIPGGIFTLNIIAVAEK